MTEKKIQCITCHHNMEQSDCGSCIDKTQHLLESPEKKVDQFKYMCKIVVNDPKEFDRVDPLNCQFYFPIFFRI